MDRIGVRELRQHASRYLAQVAASREPIEITDNGRPVARLVPVVSDEWSNLIAAAEVTPADPAIDVLAIEPLAIESFGVTESGGHESASVILERLREQER